MKEIKKVLDLSMKEFENGWSDGFIYLKKELEKLKFDGSYWDEKVFDAMNLQRFLLSICLQYENFGHNKTIRDSLWRVILEIKEELK